MKETAMENALPEVTGKCPECDAPIRLTRRPQPGLLMACPRCDEMLQVTSIRPLELTWALDTPTTPFDAVG